MRFLKTIFLGLPLFLYLLQTSFPQQIHILGFTPNILLCFFLALIFFPRSRLFLFLFFVSLICLFFSSSLTLFSSTFLLIILSGWTIFLRRYYKFDKLSLGKIFAILSLSILTEACLIIFSFWQKLITWDNIFPYILKIGLMETIIHFLLIQLFIILGNLFLQNNQPKMVIKQ